MLLQYLVVGVLFACSCVSGFDSSSYTGSKVIAPLDYTVYWRLNAPANEIFLAFKVKTTGWVGFGIGEITSGSMPGADIILGYVANGTATVTDRYSYDRVEPAIDSCQDVILISGEETDGYTILEVKRSINVTDSQDRSIVYGPNRVIVAFGASDTVKYHQTSRITSEITFFGAPLYSNQPVPDELTIDLKMDNYLVPDGKTQYACQTFVMPTDQDYMITQIEPLVNQSNVGRVHHFVAHVVLNLTLDMTTSLATQYMRPGPCNPLQGQVTKGWVGMLSAWAAGGGSQYTPEEAGFPMGQKPSSIKYVVLELHYNNPDGKGGYMDDSGIRLHYSTTIRKYEADVLIIGDPFTSFAPIPSRSYVDMEAECLSECTATFPTDLQVFGSFPHMHQAGAMAWSTQWRDNQLLREIGRIEYFDFNHQQVYQVNFTIQRGDRFNTHCVYNTSDRANQTIFGMASTDEMCMHFFFYYPRMVTPMMGISYPNNFCGRFYGDKTGHGNGSICGSPFGYNFSNPNPQHIDPFGGINITFGVAPPSDQCAVHATTSIGVNVTTTSGTTTTVGGNGGSTSGATVGGSTTGAPNERSSGSVLCLSSLLLILGIAFSSL